MAGFIFVAVGHNRFYVKYSLRPSCQRPHSDCLALRSISYGKDLGDIGPVDRTDFGAFARTLRIGRRRERSDKDGKGGWRCADLPSLSERWPSGHGASRKSRFSLSVRGLLSGSGRAAILHNSVMDPDGRRSGHNFYYVTLLRGRALCNSFLWAAALCGLS